MSLEQLKLCSIAFSRRYHPNSDVDPKGCAYELSLQTPLASPISVNDAASHLYVNAHKFHKVINVGLFAVTQGCLRFVVVKTGFQPVVWDQTWNQPAGWGPFKEIIFDSIEVEIG